MYLFLNKRAKELLSVLEKQENPEIEGAFWEGMAAMSNKIPNYEALYILQFGDRFDDSLLLFTNLQADQKIYNLSMKYI